MLDKREEKTIQGIKSVEYAFLILDTIKQHKEPLTLTEISRLTKMSKSRLQKYMISFLEMGVLTRNNKNFTYRLGSKLLEIGIHALNNHDLVAIADTYLKKIRKELKQTSALNIWTENGPMVVKSEPSGQPVGVDIQVGYQPPLLRSSTGKCFVAFKEFSNMKENINKEIQKCDVDTQEIEKELEEIRENGYSFRDTISENVPGGMAIACPIFNGSGVMLAVLSVIGFPGSLNTDPDSKEVKKIKEIASDLVKELH